MERVPLGESNSKPANRILALAFVGRELVVKQQTASLHVGPSIEGSGGFSTGSDIIEV
jgi:hypothetical protein